MPRGRWHASGAGRLVAPAVLLFAAILIGWVIIGSGGGYRVTAELESSSQLVKGNQVQIGGIPVGSVKDVKLGPRNLAEIEISVDGDHSPLPLGTRAVVRSRSAASIAARSVNLMLGPSSAPDIPDGGRIPIESSESVVETDEFFDTLDLTTTRRVRRVLIALRDALDGRGQTLNDAFRLLDPAASRSQVLFAEIARDEPALRRVIRGGSDVVSTLASHRESLTGGVESALGVAEALASERRSLSRTIGNLPSLLRRSNTTLVNLRSTLADVRPAIGEARPVARGATRLLPELRPVARRLRATIPNLRRLIRTEGAHNDLLDLLADLPALNSAGTPVISDLVPALDELNPIIDEIRPYVPDLAAATTSGGFGGSSFGSYDGNGHYARIGVQAGPFSLSRLQLPQPEILGNRKGLVKNCPGGATRAAPDRSNPFRDRGQTPCDPSIQQGAR